MNGNCGTNAGSGMNADDGAYVRHSSCAGYGSWISYVNGGRSGESRRPSDTDGYGHG